MNGHIQLGGADWGNCGGGWVVDNGFGNIVRSPSRGPCYPNKTVAPGVSTDGREWLRIAGQANPDPLFSNSSVSTWAGTNATLSTIALTMPGAPYGQSLDILATANGGYASKGFSVSANTDYLVSVAFQIVCVPNSPVACNNTNERIQILNSRGSVYDSGTISWPGAIEGQKFRIFRAWVPVTTDTTLTVRIYALNNAVHTIVPMVLITPSAFQQSKMGGNPTFGSSCPSSGSGQSTAYSADAASHSCYIYFPSSRTGPTLVRAVVNVPVGSGAILSIGGNINSYGAGPIIAMIADGKDHEYVIPLPQYPANNSQVQLAWLSGAKAPTWSQVGAYVVSLNQTSALNCFSTASPAACGAASAGTVRITPGSTSLTVNTTAATANSIVGCLAYSTAGLIAPTNMASLSLPYVSAVNPGTSFTLTLPVAPVTNPVNVTYCLIN